LVHASLPCFAYDAWNIGGQQWPNWQIKKELLKFMGDAHAQHFKVAGLLLVAHAGSLAACATILKDSASTPRVSGFGVFALLFGIGLIASIAYYASVFMTRAVVGNALMSDEDPNDSPSAGFLKALNVTSLAVALVTLLAAIVLVIWRSFL
jgi:hypothetical protein